MFTTSFGNIELTTRDRIEGTLQGDFTTIELPRNIWKLRFRSKLLCVFIPNDKMIRQERALYFEVKRPYHGSYEPQDAFLVLNNLGEVYMVTRYPMPTNNTPDWLFVTLDKLHYSRVMLWMMRYGQDFTQQVE